MARMKAFILLAMRDSNRTPTPPGPAALAKRIDRFANTLPLLIEVARTPRNHYSIRQVSMNRRDPAARQVP